MAAKISTPHHQCQQAYGGGQTCPHPAFRRVDGLWLCRTHARLARRRLDAKLYAIPPR